MNFKTFRRRILIPICLLGPAAYFCPYLTAFYIACGGYDLYRNRKLKIDTVRQYFLGNGALTWILSPFNILLDFLALPYVNKGVYSLDDLPKPYRDEISQLLAAASDANLVSQLDAQSKLNARTMIFVRWYGRNVDTFLDAHAFNRPWKYIETIGVSIFNHRVSTSKHFGYTRASLRLLYNLNDMKDESTYIVVGDKTNYWRDQKLFIFDDTLLHQSVNQTDDTRYCLFVDFIRPSPFPFVMKGAVAIIRTTISSFKHVLYKNWKVIQ